MRRVIGVIGVIGVGALAIWAGQPLNAGEEKALSTKEIMVRAHKGSSSLIAVVSRNVRAADPNWDEVQEKTKEMVHLGTLLAKNEPDQGTKESWDKLSKNYLDAVKGLESAAAEKQKESAQAAFKKLMGTCSACHKAHRAG